jgi:hypothetical protein
MGRGQPDARPLLSIAAEPEGRLSAFRDGVGECFDARMSTLSAAYRRHVKWLLLGIAIVVTLVFNVDSIRAASAFYEDETLRAAVSERAIVLPRSARIGPARSSPRASATRWTT